MGMYVALLLATVVNWSVPLEGPWRFNTGDNLRWADPAFDDRPWATLSLAAPADANDGDQGITHYAAGWAAHGYNGYAGFAWYRIRVASVMPAAGDLALLGPAMVDNAYEIYVDGRLLGGIGDFTRAPPVAYCIRPMKFGLPSGKAPMLIAVRVWMGAWAAGPRAGGMHVAPVFGNARGVEAAYRSQWFEKIRAFALEIAQTLFFVVLALVALSLIPFDRAKLGLAMLAVALLLTAAWRANLTILWLSGIESVQAFVHMHLVLLVPITLGAWTLAWCYLFRLREFRWITILTLALTLLYVCTEFLRRPAFNGGFLPVLAPAAALASKWDRYAFFALLVFIVYRGFRERGREAWFALPAIVSISIGQFSGELLALGVPGIWFPFGMGVSLANYAYLVATPAIAVLLWSRILARAAHYDPAAPPASVERNQAPAHSSSTA
ncbi:MAG TPA: hypothetical protein VGI19_19430 [Candidatus Cybelea sp.]